jgi:hypothetical protein
MAQLPVSASAASGGMWAWGTTAAALPGCVPSSTPTVSTTRTLSASPSQSASPSAADVTAAAAGAACSADAACASGSCKGGICCSPFAVQLGCSDCAAGSGACVSRYPGEVCGSNMDCGTNMCQGCCCAASALVVTGCMSCKCWSAPGTTAASAGTCTSPAPPPSPPSNVTLPCNATTSASGALELSRVIAFPSALNVADAVPLLFLPAGSPLNREGVDIVVATASACAAFAALPGSSQCAQARAFALPNGPYFYLGPASALGMTAAPACAA